MVGRERELEAGERLVAGLSCSGCLILEGEAGIGKTTVWRGIVAHAQAVGCRVLSCRPAAAEARLSFSGLADLLTDVDRRVFASLPAPQRTALEIALLEAAPGAVAPDPRAVFAGFRSVLAEVAADRPVIIAVDDLQWLDRPSQAALEFTLRRFGRHPIRFLCSVRVGEAPVLTPGLARALAETDAERVALGALSVGALHEVFVARLGRGLPRPIVVRIAAATRGNPFYALEIACELLRRGEFPPGTALPVPSDLSELVMARIRRLPLATRDALLMAAGLSSPVLELVDRAALEPAEAADLIEIGSERVLFSHPLFASAVYGALSAAERRGLHRRLASIVSDPEERAWHLALGAEGASEEIALELEHAAEGNIMRGAPDAAAELLELAVRLTPAGGERWHARALAAGECHFHAGDRARARSLAEQVLGRGAQGSMRGHGLQLLGEVRYHEHSYSEAVPLLEEALTLIGDGRRAVEIHANLQVAHWNLGDIDAQAEHAHAAVELASALGEDGPTAVALASAAIADANRGRPVDRARVELALALEDHDQRLLMAMRPSLIAGVLEFCSDNFDRSASLLSALRRRTIDRGEESDLPALDSNLSLVERSRGSVLQALEFASEGCEISLMLGSQIGLADNYSERCFVRATLGDIDGARADAERAAEAAKHADVGFAAIWLRQAVGFLELSLGDARSASEALEPVAEIVERSGSDAFLAIGLADKIEALVALGELGRADDLTAALERHGSVHARASALARAARGRALAAAARGELTAARAEVERSVAKLGTIRMPLELGRSLLVKGQIERRCKQKRAARESLGGALKKFEAVGARLWIERARAELERTGMTHSRGDALTPTELRVAALAADGLTNRRIAEAVFLSTRTVEANLARIYLKLGIGSRAELGRAMADRERAGAAASPRVEP